MRVNIRKKYNLKKFIQKTVDFFNSSNSRPIIAAIKEDIAQGKSPVAGERPFKAYSPSYKEMIRRGIGDFKGKQITPVNLKLSGDMLKSLEGFNSKTGITIRWNSPIAQFHNDLGAGKSKVIRRILPNRKGETWSRRIMQKIKELLQKAITRQK